VGKRRRRFPDKRRGGLLEEPGPGSPRKITDAGVQCVIPPVLDKLALTPPARAPAQWLGAWVLAKNRQRLHPARLSC
ncbi:MAG: hypothetical protein OXC69_04425, partial [Candidatus Tectomicrobia bacterium]|nr:hypothetical protein [Candidatus Tectomicrobia bacterium]